MQATTFLNRPGQIKKIHMNLLSTLCRPTEHKIGYIRAGGVLDKLKFYYKIGETIEIR
jgi:hypothetical protein